VVGHRPGPWGWHRLAPAWADRLVADASFAPGDLVLDIGAGTGALTAPLVDAGARVVAFELHPGRAAALRRRFAGADVTVVQADAGDLRLPRRPFRVVANPPFGVTTAVLARLLAPGSRLVAADLVLQRAAAERWAAGRAPGAGRWSRDYRLAVGPGVPRSAFSPRPAVPCAVLRISRPGPGRR
jgi:23S rRNA (adenine-N6)-dimethyltransferase